MNATGIQDELRHRLELAERWDSEADTDGVFRHCSDLLLTARALEAAASAQSPGGLNPAVLGCFGAVLDSLGTVSLMLDRAGEGRAEAQTPEDGQADAAHLLFAINQNLRFAAQAAELGQQTLADSRGDNG